jgi:actin-related protein
MDEEISAIVIDNSSFLMKVGLAGDEAPSCMFRSVVGYRTDGKFCYDPHRIFVRLGTGIYCGRRSTT